MVPATGQVFELGEAVFGGSVPPIGAQVEMEAMRAEVARLAAMGKPLTDSERAAAAEASLVMVGAEAAARLRLGAREQERRRKRRKTSSASRRANR